MAKLGKHGKVAFSINADDLAVLEWQRQRLATYWSAVGHLKDPTLADAARTLLHVAAAFQGYVKQTPVESIEQCAPPVAYVEIDP